MKTLYLECSMGAAGDMLMAALLELHPDRDGFLTRLNSLGLPGVRVESKPSAKCGIWGTHVRVLIGQQEEESLDETAEHEHVHGHHHNHSDAHSDAHKAHDHPAHHHTGLREIEAIVNGLSIPANVQKDALAVYRLIAEAESKAHGKPVEQVHFHEVGMMDAIADIVGVSLLLNELNPKQILASPVHVGSGHVRCAHGILPVPAPATAYILRGVPTYGGKIRGELCTPTGAALLKHFVTKFGDMPVMRVEHIGYGCGTKDFEIANCVRAMLGETTDDGLETIIELSCNLDDMTPEAIGFALENILTAGALDVFHSPIGMKKFRPGVLLTCLCRPDDREKMVALLFHHTTTLGIRETVCQRYQLSRSVQTVKTQFGPVRIKESKGWGVTRCKPEYDDLSTIARQMNLALAEVYDRIAKELAEG